MKPKSKLLRRSLLVLFLALIVVSMLKPRINPTEASPDATFSVVPSSVTDVEPPNSFSVDVYGYDLEQAKRLSQEIAGILKTIPGITDIEISRKEGKPELQILVDREKASRIAAK